MPVSVQIAMHDAETGMVEPLHHYYDLEGTLSEIPQVGDVLLKTVLADLPVLKVVARYFCPHASGDNWWWLLVEDVSADPRHKAVLEFDGEMRQVYSEIQAEKRAAQWAELQSKLRKRKLTT